MVPLLLASALLAPESYRFAPQKRGDVTATLEVRVAVRPAAPGQGRVTLLVIVEGPSSLEVERLRLEDALEAWKAQSFSSWALVEGRVRWAESVELSQAKPGPAALPALRLRCRESAEQDWEELRWVDVLKEPRAGPPPEELPPPPPSPWPARLWVGGAVLLGLAALASLVWGGRRWWSSPARPIPAHVRALRELADLEAGLAAPEDLHARLAAVLRAYLAERFALDTDRKTSDELLEALEGEPGPSEGQREVVREVLVRCDLAKFARAAGTEEERRHVLARARAFVEETTPASP